MTKEFTKAEATDLVALSPIEMANSHVGLIEWAKAGIEDARKCVDEATEAWETARARKWSASYLRTIVLREEKRLAFFEKTKVALEAGYYIIPTFMMHTFAVRVPEGMKVPAKIKRSQNSWSSPDHSVPAKALPAAEGEYVNPKLSFYQWTNEVKLDDGKTKTEYLSENVETLSPLTFPSVMAKPRIMERASDALDIKVFDEIGIVQEAKDPIIAGLIKHPKGPSRDLLFFIAWDFDPRGF